MNVPGKSEKDLAKFSQALSEMAQGGSNALGEVVSLAPGATETPVEDKRCTEGALVAPVPLTQSAAESVVWLKETRRGGFTWGHLPSAVADRLFRYEIRRP